MNALALSLIIILVILVGTVLFLVGIYNKLVSLRQGCKNGWAQIEVQLKRRYDLIPNLIETAKAYMAHEAETLEAVIKARQNSVDTSKLLETAAANPGMIKKLAGAESILSGSVGRLLAVAEQYPDLKANENMIQLTNELSETEDKIAYARQAYNDAVMRYNTASEVFPNVLIAGNFGFKPEELFEVDEDEKEAIQDAPKVDFS